MIRALLWLLALGLVLAAAGLYLTRPVSRVAQDLSGIPADPARGEQVFHAAGCASCHAAPDSDGAARLVLAGGKSFVTPTGTFYAPNISQDNEAGIGSWSREAIVSAVMEGVSPDGRHYYPSFPYGSYAKAEIADIAALADYLKTLPADPTPSRSHDLQFPFSIRAGIGAWKLLNVRKDWVFDAGDDPVLQRGRYLAEALGHCGECHTPRDLTMGLETGNWFAGAPNPSGRGRIPNITPAKLTWSAADIAAYLKDGFTPEFDAVGGSMTDVVTSLSNLPDSDRAAIAAYLKALPPAE